MMSALIIAAPIHQKATFLKQGLIVSTTLYMFSGKTGKTTTSISSQVINEQYFKIAKKSQLAKQVISLIAAQYKNITEQEPQ